MGAIFGISAQDQELVNEFVQAAKMGDLEKVRAMKDMQLNGKTDSGDTALHMAAMNGHLNIVLELLEEGSALENDARDNSLATPLMLACGGGHLEISQKLMKYGANPSLLDILSWTALHHACSNGHAVCVIYLIDRMKRECLFQLDSSGCSPLWLAAAAVDPETVRILLCYGANPLERNSDGISVSQAATSEVDDDSNRVLVQNMLSVACKVWKSLPSEEGEEVDDLLESAKSAENSTMEGGRDLFTRQGTAEGGPALYELEEDDPFDVLQIEGIRQRAIPLILKEEIFSRTYLRPLGSGQH